MQQHLGLASPALFSTSDENHVFAEVEAIVGGTSSESGQNDGSLAFGRARRGRRRYTLLLISAVAMTAMLVPAGLKTGGLLARAAHMAAID